ncbi:MAG: AMP-binding protein [Clostridia bacterium]|nr:AMP-binding protein [Clostridia bacterium]
MEKYICYNNLAEMIEKSAEKFGGKIAFSLKEKNVSYNDLLSDVKAVSRLFSSRGYVGKRIALIGKNCYEWMLVHLATMYTGSVLVPLDKGLKDYEIQSQISRSKADVLFVAGKMELPEMDINIESASNELLLEAKALPQAENEKYDIDNNKMSMLLFTSGTTDNSKAVMLSQYNITSNIYALSYHEHFTSDDVSLIILPLHHTFGMVGLLLFLSLGMNNAFCDGLKITKSIDEHKATILVGVPLIADAIYKTATRKINEMGMENLINTLIKVSRVLLKLRIDLRKLFFGKITKQIGQSLRLIIMGGAALNPDVEQWFHDIGFFTVQGYGLTECSPVLCAENPENMRLGSVGVAMPGIDIRIDNPDETGIGEIIAKGDNIMLGYYENQELTDEVLKGGYFHTGDLGYIDEDGFIWITGRKKNMIALKNGKNVFPEELEELIYKYDFIKECMVYGENDGDKDLISAYIVCDKDKFPGKTDEQIKEIVDKTIKEINSKLISYKQIRNVIVSDKPLERTSTFKIKRNQKPNNNL